MNERKNSDGWCEVANEQLAVANETDARAGPDLDLMQRSLGHYADGMGRIAEAAGTDARLVQMGFVSQALSSLRAAYDLAYRGYYLQAISLFRFVQECWITFWYLSQHLDKGHLWIENHSKHKPPKVTTMIREMKLPANDLRGKVSRMRSELDHFSHAEHISVRYLFCREDKRLTVYTGVAFDCERFSACAYGIVLWTGLMTDALACWILPVDEWHQRTEPLMMETLEYMARVEHSP